MIAMECFDEGSYKDPPLPAEATSTQVGSVARIEVMRQRLERNEHLYHPDDCKEVSPELNIEKMKKLMELQYPEGKQLAQFKKCTKCEEVKPTTQFQLDMRRRDGLVSWCKSCVAEYTRIRRSHFQHGSKGIFSKI